MPDRGMKTMVRMTVVDIPPATMNVSGGQSGSMSVETGQEAAVQAHKLENSHLLEKGPTDIIRAVSPHFDFEEVDDGINMTVRDIDGTETVLIPRGPEGPMKEITDEEIGTPISQLEIMNLFSKYKKG